MIFTGAIQKFFRAPGEPWPEGDTGEGMLFNLRDDLVRLYGPETQFKGLLTEGIFLPLSGMMSGLDYIGKAYCGKPGADSFVLTVQELGKLNEDKAEAIYQLRCGLIHELGLKSTSSRPRRKGIPYKFYINGDPHPEFEYEFGSIVINKPESANNAPPSRLVYKVNYWGIKQLFLNMIVALRRVCDDTNHAKHSEVFNRVIRMSQETLIEVA